MRERGRMKYQLGTVLSIVLFLVSTSYTKHQEKSQLYYGAYSDDFVHRWGIQKIADHSYDPRLEAFPTDPDKCARFDPDAIKPGDIIFVRDICSFMKELHPHIKNPYVILTAGDYKDRMACEFIDFLDEDTIIAWFCVHPCTRRHPKHYWLPLGIFQSREFSEKQIDLNKLFALWRNIPKPELLCCNFGLRPQFKPERNPIFDVFADEDFCFKCTRKPFLEYMKEMGQYKFTLSPRGLGPDCYRTWEAMLVGCIPVLHSCYIDDLYSDLPVLFIDRWEDVTPEFLEQKYQEITSKKYDIDKLFMEYWWKKIEHVRDEYLKNNSR